MVAPWLRSPLELRNIPRIVSQHQLCPTERFSEMMGA